MATEKIILYDSENDIIVEAYVCPEEAQSIASGTSAM